jgi:hypothetical protein
MRHRPPAPGRWPQQQRGADDQAQGDERVGGQEGDAGQARASAGLRWQTDEVDRHAQQEHAGQAHDLVAGEMPHQSQAGQHVLADGVVTAAAGIGGGHGCLP